MKKYIWEIKLVIILLSISYAMYFIQYLKFGHAANIFESILSQIAFLPIYVLLVTLIIEQLLYRREKQAIISKLNPLIGLFFNEMGRHLVKEFLISDRGCSTIRKDFIFTNSTFGKKYKSTLKAVESYNPDVHFNVEQLKSLKSFVFQNKKFLLQLMENPNLLEHESFTELILSVFHLYQELSLRENLESLPESDYNHLNIDIERSYSLLIREWLLYLKYLRNEYSYLFSVELRTNPFDIKADIVIKE